MIDANRLYDIMIDCLFSEEDIKDGPPAVKDTVEVQGVMATYIFNKERVRSHKDEVLNMLLELPVQFAAGESFLNACQDQHGNQWGEHRDVEALMVLGIANQLVKVLIPREEWHKWGGVPVFRVLTTAYTMNNGPSYKEVKENPN